MAEPKINGVHILQLCTRDYSETVAFSEIVNELGESYRDRVLFGSNAGNREFSIAFENLGTTDQVFEIDGALFAPAAYLWELFCLQKTEDFRIAVQSSVNGQYYLVEFADSRFTLQKALVALFSGQTVFRQLRKTGVSVFDVSKIPGVWAEYYFPSLAQADNTVFDSVVDSSGNSRDATILSDVHAVKPKYRTNQQNGLGVGRFTDTGGSETWPLFREEDFTFYWALIVAKFDGASFSTYSGALTALTTHTFFTGNSGDGLWFDQSYDDEYFSSNGVAYAPSAKPGPMSKFTISFIQIRAGLSVDGIQIGRDRDESASRTWKGDIGHIIVGGSPLPASTRNELIEHVQVLWKV